MYVTPQEMLGTVVQHTKAEFSKEKQFPPFVSKFKVGKGFGVQLPCKEDLEWQPFL